jgi:hypothetical protein
MLQVQVSFRCLVHPAECANVEVSAPFPDAGFMGGAALSALRQGNTGEDCDGTERRAEQRCPVRASIHVPHRSGGVRRQ